MGSTDEEGGAIDGRGGVPEEVPASDSDVARIKDSVISLRTVDDSSETEL